MQEDQRPLFSLTVEEFKVLSKSIAINNSYLIKPLATEEKDQRDNIFINEVIVLTGYKESTVYSKVSRKEIPVISYGRPLTFSKEDILKWMKSGKPSVAEMTAQKFINDQKNKR
jgi:predicted DNA-binding transcriptional regulator AlpA